ncbi:integrase core domain-containing protein [Streptomyces sp. NPDC006510]|uniref:integrase core domain-containing protein n=1 Tax=Streptomyces sp. NPDC006510 TaxID=3155600 RepID=UPI0033AA7E2D
MPLPRVEQFAAMDLVSVGDEVASRWRHDPEEAAALLRELVVCTCAVSGRPGCRSPSWRTTRTDSISGSAGRARCSAIRATQAAPRCWNASRREARVDSAALMEALSLAVEQPAPRAPRMNAHCERLIGTIRREALDHVLILGEDHARKVLTDYQDHYNGHRPHRSRQQLPPSATEQPAIVHDLDDRSMLRTRVLGGLINEYRYAARR